MTSSSSPDPPGFGKNIECGTTTEPRISVQFCNEYLGIQQWKTPACQFFDPKEVARVA